MAIDLTGQIATMSKLIIDKVWIEIMMNDDNLESNSTELLVY